MKKGLYIVFEGIAGSGKSVQSNLLLARLQKQFPRKHIIRTREPGGSEIAGAIRRIVQATEFEEEMEPVCEAYLYAAARSHSLRKVVAPVLKRDGIVISDRSYITSIANQGSGRGLSTKLVMEINKVAVDGIVPDRVYFIDTDVKTALKRASDTTGDKFEKYEVDFYKKVVAGYKEAGRLLKKVWVSIDGSGTVDDIHNKIYADVLKLLHG